MLVEDVIKQPIYVSRNLLNSRSLVAWAHSQGFTKVTHPDELHATILYSKEPVVWSKLHRKPDIIRVPPARVKSITKLGQAIALTFVCPQLTSRHEELLGLGGSSDFNDFIPHITISYTEIDLDKIKPFDQELVFGPEIFKPLSVDWQPRYAEDPKFV